MTSYLTIFGSTNIKMIAKSNLSRTLIRIEHEMEFDTHTLSQSLLFPLLSPLSSLLLSIIKINSYSLLRRNQMRKRISLHQFDRPNVIATTTTTTTFASRCDGQSTFACIFWSRVWLFLSFLCVSIDQKGIFSHVVKPKNAVDLSEKMNFLVLRLKWLQD